MSEKELIEYFEHVRFQVACFDRKKKSVLPQTSGSGFILDVDGHAIFVTAGHVASTHHNATITDDKLMTIQTNTICSHNVSNTSGCILVTVCSVVSISSFTIDSTSGMKYRMGTMDVSFAELTDERKNAPFVTQNVTLNGSNVLYGEPKRRIPVCDIVSVNNNDVYSVFGRVHLYLENNQGQWQLQSKVIFHTGLKFIGCIGDYIVLKYNNPVIIKDWKGLSGSPVLNQNGKLIGVACAVDPIANTLLVTPIQKIMPMIHAEIMTNGVAP